MPLSKALISISLSLYRLVLSQLTTNPEQRDMLLAIMNKILGSIGDCVREVYCIYMSVSRPSLLVVSSDSVMQIMNHVPIFLTVCQDESICE